MYDSKEQKIINQKFCFILQMINKVSNLEKQSIRNIAKVKQECEETVKRHQNFIDQVWMKYLFLLIQ